MRAVLAGVGEARNQPEEGLTDAVALMAGAARAAAADAGAPALLEKVRLVCAPVGSDGAPDPAGAAAHALGLTEATTIVAAVGVSQQFLVNRALRAVESGEAEAVLVLGGEAKASALQARRSGATTPTPPEGPGASEVFLADAEFMARPEVEAQLWDPVAQYALMDSALGRPEGRTPAQLRVDVSELMARFDRVACTNPHAVFAGAGAGTGTPCTADWLATTSEENRLLAHPYNKWHSTQWALDHAAALLITTEDLALAHGTDPDGLVYPHVALDTSWGLSLSRRALPHRWPTMEVMGAAAAAALGHPVGEIDLLELYSCFPAAVRFQQRALELPLDGTPTVLGGMAFAGGPFNHFTYMATTELVRRLRATDSTSGPRSLAALSTVSGLLTKGGLMVWGREPAPGGRHDLRGPLIADLADEVQRATPQVTVADFGPERGLLPGDSVIAATVTGGLRPSTYALVDDREGLRHVVQMPAPTSTGPEGVDDAIEELFRWR